MEPTMALTWNLTHVQQLGGKMLKHLKHEKHTSSQSGRMIFLL